MAFSHLYHTTQASSDQGRKNLTPTHTSFCRRAKELYWELSLFYDLQIYIPPPIYLQYIHIYLAWWLREDLSKKNRALILGRLMLTSRVWPNDTSYDSPIPL
ncbi:unnamed protein product, partial [Cuscuta epithymum]